MIPRIGGWHTIRNLATIATLAWVATGCTEPFINNLDWQNSRLRATWTRGESALTLSNRQTGQRLAIPIGPTELEIDSGKVSGFDGSSARPMVIPAIVGEVWRFSWPAKPLPGSGAAVRCRTSIELDRSSPRIGKRVVIEIERSDRPVLLKEVVIDALSLKGLNARQPFEGWQSYPVLCDSFYAGVEFPAAQAVVRNDIASLSCKPGVRLAAGQSYHAKPTVYGVCPSGRSREAFESYIASLRPLSPPMHIQYNSWWSAPYPFTEQHMLDIIRVFQQQYYGPHGGPLDSFCLDMGWARSQSMWQIDSANFPQGFRPLARELGRMGASVALWTSPSSCYPHAGGLDSEWAMRNGYETFKTAKVGGIRYACLAGPKYAAGFRDALVRHVRKYRIAHYKFDGYQPMCPERDHGHEPGELSAEKMAEGFIATCQALRKSNPSIWMEATCFGFKPSPWWLAHVNTVIGTFGDDAPGGRVACPVYRESYTTARDFFNLQGARDILMPIYAQEVLGIIHQTAEPLQNDAVVSVLRGHSFIPLYINPKHMTPRRWRFLAHLMTWSRRNADLLAHTKPILTGDWNDERKTRVWEQDIPRDPYGYAHFDRGRGLLMVRNPWAKPRQVELKLDESLGVDKNLANAPMACLYPQFGRLAGYFSYGHTLTLELRPYETRLIALGGYQEAPALPEARSKVTADALQSEISPDHRVRLAFTAGGHAPDKQLWLLCEAKTPFQMPESRVTAGGRTIEAQVSESAAGWRAGRSAPGGWTWAIFDLPAGTTRVEAEFQPQDDVRASAWLIGKEAVDDEPKTSGPIPPPEERILDAVEILAPVALSWNEPANKVNVALTAEGAKATASSVWAAEHTPDKAIDGNPETRWNSAKGETAGAWLSVDFGKPFTISTINFKEAAGGRITSYKLQVGSGNEWKDLITAVKPAKRTIVRHRFPAVETSRIRLLVVAATEVPTIYEIEAK
ncbi:MAG: discoidin domain-containing protein [Phycisphaerae bacterium]|nr:discoidin domain-containing protein [Phycisphaerae bacterium]